MHGSTWAPMTCTTVTSAFSLSYNSIFALLDFPVPAPPLNVSSVEAPLAVADTQSLAGSLCSIIYPILTELWHPFPSAYFSSSQFPASSFSSNTTGPPLLQRAAPAAKVHRQDPLPAALSPAAAVVQPGSGQPNTRPSSPPPRQARSRLSEIGRAHV